MDSLIAEQVQAALSRREQRDKSSSRVRAAAAKLQTTLREEQQLSSFVDETGRHSAK